MAKKAASRKAATSTKTSRTSTRASKPAGKAGAKPTAQTSPAAEPAEEATATAATMDRRAKGPDRRAAADRRQKDAPVAVERRKSERRKVPRRRQIDPTTCERDYSDDEVEFMNALDHYKRTSGRMFPTCSEILEVIRNLGYEKRLAVVPLAQEVGQTHESGLPAAFVGDTPHVEVPVDLRAELEPQL